MKRESAITSGQTIGALRANENAACAARLYLKSHQMSWQRNEAETGLIACARLLLGLGIAATIDEGSSRTDARLVINGMPYSIAAIAAV